METKKHLKNLIQEKIKEFLNENEMEERKVFKVTDKTGRSMKPYILNKNHIEKTWDLTEEDWTTEETLGDFLENCYIGDVWDTQTDKIECIKILKRKK